MSIHYKFKTALEYDTVTFDGLHIALKDLKKQILHQKKIGKNTDFDLQVTDAQTKKVYEDDNELISKNASLIIARIPLSAQAKKLLDRENHLANSKNSNEPTITGGPPVKSVDIATLDVSEEEKIKTMMSQSTSEYDPSK